MADLLISVEDFPSDDVWEEVARSLWELEDDVDFSRLSALSLVSEAYHSVSFDLSSGSIPWSRPAAGEPGPEWAASLFPANTTLSEEDFVSIQRALWEELDDVAFSSTRGMG
ncbi:unnamed protein product [Calypogeia fissa]